MCKKVFVITKCGSSYNNNNEIIKYIIEEIFNFECIIAEQKYTSRDKILLEDIYEDIKNADYVFIDLIPSNFNIAFEAGITYTLNRINNQISNKPIPDFYFLTPKYMFDLDLIASDMKGLKHFTYKNYKEYAIIIKKCLEGEINNTIEKDLDNYINNIAIKNSENFLDYNSLAEKFNFNNSQLKFIQEGMQISFAHFPIYYKNFEFFNDYELIIKARIDLRRLGIAIHVQDDEENIINLLTLPMPSRCFMFNISENGECLPHIFDSNILHSSLHYWPFYNHKLFFHSVKANEFFLLNIRVNESKIIISINSEEQSLNIEELNSDEFNNKDCMDEYLKNNPEEFKNRIKKLLLTLKRGSFGFRVHPNEKATIKSLEYKIY